MTKVIDSRIENHRAKTYKTDHYTAEQIAYLNDNATDQEKEIARFFFMNPDLTIGPGKTHERNGYTWPLTSTRRAITNLTDAGILEKTDRTSEGKFGKPEHQWKWKFRGKVVQPQEKLPTHRDLVLKQRRIDAGKQPRFQGDLAFEGDV